MDKEKIINRLLELKNEVNPSPEAPDNQITMFDLVSAYNDKYENNEGIGGSFIRENIPELKDLP